MEVSLFLLYLRTSNRSYNSPVAADSRDTDTYKKRTISEHAYGTPHDKSFSTQ